MLVNLIPEFLSVLAAPDRAAAYHEYLDRHRPVLGAYWHNYVLDPESPHAEQIIAAALRADRTDLTRLLDDVDVVAIAEDALRRASVLRMRASSWWVAGASRSCVSSISPGAPTRRPTGWASRRSCCRCGSRTRWRTSSATRHPRVAPICGASSESWAATTTTGRPARGRHCASCWRTRGPPSRRHRRSRRGSSRGSTWATTAANIGACASWMPSCAVPPPVTSMPAASACA